MKRYVNFIFISSDWLHYHRREFIKTLSEKINSWGEIVIVEAPVSLSVNLFVKFKNRFLPLIKGELKSGRVENGFVFITPVILFHRKLWGILKLLNRIDTFLIKLQIRNLFKNKYRDHKLVLWLYEPEQYLLAESFRNANIIYDYYDDHEFDFNGNPIENKIYKNRSLVSLSDLTICLSKFSTERLSKYNENVIFLKNSCSTKSYHSYKKTNVDEYYSGLNDKKIIGYLGTVRNWIDFTYIEEVLIKIRNANVVLVGPVLKNVENEVEKLRIYNNFFTIGFVHPDHIYDHIRKFDVGIIPFKINNFTKSVFPNKFFEYAISSVPVVSSSLPELEEYKNSIGFAGNESEFVDFCRKALEGEFKEKITSNKFNAEQNSWDKNLSDLNIILKKKLGIE
ncbi:MAG TPA: glycosyltransferase [Ignavibacteria bacterium]|nr:glycosyltransferase [Ignavibacteria bacterium]HMR40230.1 glycosyltransferase [Ignavibacteria bacterium]